MIFSTLLSLCSTLSEVAAETQSRALRTRVNYRRNGQANRTRSCTAESGHQVRRNIHFFMPFVKMAKTVPPHVCIAPLGSASFHFPWFQVSTKLSHSTISGGSEVDIESMHFKPVQHRCKAYLTAHHLFWHIPDGTTFSTRTKWTLVKLSLTIASKRPKYSIYCSRVW